MTITIKQAIETAGGVAAVASLFSIRPVSIYEWIARGWVPAEKCREIEKVTNGAVRCEDLNSKVDWAYLRAASEPEKASA